MKLQKLSIFLLAAAAMTFASCSDDKTADPATAAINVDKNDLSVNESVTIRFLGSAERVVIYPGDEGQDYELRNQANSGLVVNKGLLTYSYSQPGVYKMVCVATNEKDAGNSVMSDTCSVWIKVTDKINTIKGVSVNVLNRNEVAYELVSDSEWAVALPRKVRFNGKDVNFALKSQSILVSLDSPSGSVLIKEDEQPEESFAKISKTKKYNIGKVLNLRSFSGSGDQRDYNLYCFYNGEFKTFKLAGVTGSLLRNEFDYATTTIDIEVPAGTDLTSLAPQFTLNDPANEKVFIGETEQTSGTPVDFSSPVTYRFVSNHPDKPTLTAESFCVVTVTTK